MKMITLMVFFSFLNFSYQEAFCGVMSPDNGCLSHVRKTITLAKVICNEGYHISVSNFSVCNDDQEIESDALFGSSPMCIPDDVTASRYPFPTLPTDTTKMSLITPTDKQNADMENCVEEATGFYGSDVIINCSLDPNANGIYWYYDNEDEPLIQCLDDEKSGTGHDRGEYGIDRNGSLLIKDVHFTHEGNYRVVIIWGTTDDAKHEQFNVKFSVIEHCPPYQTGNLGKDVVIVCHFKPNFREVRWFNDTAVDEPLIECEGSEMCCPSIEKFIITSNGSLIIRCVSEENTGNYTVLLTDANNNTSRYQVTFVAEASCGVMSPDNSYLSHVRKTITLAKVICNEGYHISVSNYSVCNDDQEIESDALFGSSPMCIPDDVTASRYPLPTLPSDTTKMSLTTPTYEQNDDIGGCVAHESCKNCKIVLIIASVFFPLLVVLNAVAILKLYFRKNNTQSSTHKLTEEEHKLREEPGESSL